MSSKKVYLDHIKDLLESAEKTLLFVSGIDFDQFINDEKTIIAVIGAIEIIGEASKKIPENFRTQNSETPRREISGTRDKLIHEY
jgi:uncharacterized protein with HEPN domain